MGTQNKCTLVYSHDLDHYDEQHIKDLWEMVKGMEYPGKDSAVEELELQWYTDISSFEFEQIVEWLTEEFKNNEYFLFTGEMNTWNTNKSVGAVFYTVDELLQFISEYELKITKEGYKLFFELIHQDASHYFELRPINRKGAERYENYQRWTNGYSVQNGKEIDWEKFKERYTTNFYKQAVKV